jgi:predicted nucleic acid-binding protein
VIVVDASVWVSRLVPQDVYHVSSRRWLEQYLAGGGRLIEPILLLAEVAGAVARRTGQADLAHQAVRNLIRLRALRIVPIDHRLGRLAAELAADLSLRGADATYVAISQYLNTPLVTWNGDQQAKADKAIKIYTPDTLGLN